MSTPKKTKQETSKQSPKDGKAAAFSDIAAQRLCDEETMRFDDLTYAQTTRLLSRAIALIKELNATALEDMKSGSDICDRDFVIDETFDFLSYFDGVMGC